MDQLVASLIRQPLRSRCIVVAAVLAAAAAHAGCLLDFPLAPPVDADAPRLFFTDLASIPDDGAGLVTLYGARFGAAAGSVSLDDTELDVVSWRDDRATVRAPRGASLGEAQLVLHSAAGRDSNALVVGVHSGVCRFVAPGGDDDHDGSEAAPLRTLTAGRDALAAGDVLYVRAGEYVEEDELGAVLSLRDLPSGTASAPIAIVGYPGELATLGDGTLPLGVSLFRGDGGPALDHLTLAGLSFRPTCSAVQIGGASGAHDFGRFVGNDVAGASDACLEGAVSLGGARGWRILGNTLRDNGNTKFEHGLRIGGIGAVVDVEVGWNTIEGQRGGRGIQVFGTVAGDSVTALDVHDNVLRDIDRDGVLLGDSDVSPLQLRGVRIVNNVIVGAGRCVGRAVRVANPTADEVDVLHNTMVDSGAGDRACDQSDGERGASVAIDTAVGVRVIDNLLSNRVGAVFLERDAPASVLTMSHNLYFDGAGGATAPFDDVAPVVGDPRFVSQTDLHTSAGSAATDGGIDVGVSLDADGRPRPQGAGFDIGAFER